MYNNLTPSIEELREKDMVDYLSDLGHQPSRIRNNDYWYLSPLRDEKNPSFKVNRKFNRWYDHGLGEGGNLIDFGVRFHNCSVGDFIRKVSLDFPLHRSPLIQPETTTSENKIVILRDTQLKSFYLIKYLEQRMIPLDVAREFCSEISYELNGKNYYGIGFKNNSGGYEIRNPFFKLSSSPKDITTIDNGSKNASVFEGFMDFLSFKSIHQNQPSPDTNYVILNSISFFEKARDFMEKHEVVGLYLDHDSAGQNSRQYALSLSTKYRDESRLYANYKDLNEWLVNFGKGQRKTLGYKQR